ncbi:hypothetical protein GCM10025734_02940 [Kitasatospora paranensis]
MRGDYNHLSPNDHVNLGQSTNDVYPTAVKLALHAAVGGLLPAMGRLADTFADRGRAFADVVKLGRTQLQDAVPMTLGQEFAVFALTVRDDRDQLERAVGPLREVNVGGTAIGTGLNAASGYAAAAVNELADLTGVAVRPARDPIEATQGVGAFLQLASAFKCFAMRLSKICNDLRLLASGPQAGLAEIRLPALQAGSSIMPGKVNPVLPEAVNQVCFEVVGVEAAVALAGQSGQLQLNAFEPLMAHLLLTAANRLERACDLLAIRCVAGIEADAGRLRGYAEGSAALATALNPVLGYQRATEVAQRSVAERRPVREIALEGAWFRRPRSAICSTRCVLQVDDRRALGRALRTPPISGRHRDASAEGGVGGAGRRRGGAAAPPGPVAGTPLSSVRAGVRRSCLEVGRA